ncbi:hypothetical protein S83_057812, partial [Arachis hypogaea]
WRRQGEDFFRRHREKRGLRVKERKTKRSREKENMTVKKGNTTEEGEDDGDKPAST